ncbi:MAG TPA: histidine kinase [Thermoanaerobaculia bacterium]|nr:histidine kinase [Thermoanaerobaculia bacterium]
MRRLEEICAILRRWPRTVLPDYRTLACECAEQARELFDAGKTLLAFSEGDEPWLMVAQAAARGTSWREEEEPDRPLVDEGLAGTTFLYTPGRPARLAPDGRESAVSEPIHPSILGEYDEASILCVPFESEESRGHLFVFSPRAEPEAMLAAGEVVGALLSMRFEATGYSSAAVREAVAREQTRVARDLHDGLLQSFTGVVLQLETIHSTLDTRPDEARRKITEAQALIMADQRELRRFVEQLKPRATRRDTPFDFTGRLEDLRTRFETQWGIHVVFDVERIEPLVGAFLGQETFRLIHEAVTNSAKHGGASDVRVCLRTGGSEMQIEVSDNGSGFSFHGRMTLEQMRESGSGPKALAERVQALNGHLVVDSTVSGSTVTISIPLGWGGS